MNYLFVTFICVVRYFSAESRSLNATHVDIPPEIVYAVRVSSSDNNSTPITNSGLVYSKTKDNIVKSTKFNQTLPDERHSKSLISGQQSKFYLDLPVHIPNNSDHYHNINIDEYNPFQDDKYLSDKNSTSYVLEPKHISNRFYHKSQSGYPHNNFLSPYRKTNPITSLNALAEVELNKETIPPPVRYNTKYPTLQYVPDTTEFDTNAGPYPHITYGYPYVMDKQLQILHTFKSLSESLFHMIYEIYYCMRYHWHQGVMKCMTGKSSLFEDRMFHSGEEGVDADLKEESRIFVEDLTPATAEEDDDDDEVLHGEPRGLGAEDRGTPEDPVNETESVGEERKAQHTGYGGGGGAVSAFSSGLGTGIGNGVSHQVFTYQQPKKKKKKKKKKGSSSHGSHHSSHHTMKHMIPYFVAAKAKLLSVLMIVGFLAKKAWIVSSISLMLSLLGLFAKLTSKGSHRSTEVILARPSIKDWDWDKDWDRIADEPEGRKPSTYRLVPVPPEEPTPIPLHYFEKDTDNNKEFYM